MQFWAIDDGEPVVDLSRLHGEESRFEQFWRIKSVKRIKRIARFQNGKLPGVEALEGCTDTRQTEQAPA